MDEASAMNELNLTALFRSEDPAERPGKTEVLFIDDDPGVIGGLRRMLRNQRKLWNMRFAGGPEEALRMLLEQPADVVVSDLRMPGMSGDQLLERIKEQWPETIRLILSGDANKGAVYRTVGPAHRFLAKPCQPDDLMQAVLHATNMRGVLTSRKLQGIASRMESIPSLPELYQDLHQLLREPDVRMEQVAAVISRDPGMTAKILKLVNSAFFGLRRTVTSAEHAVNILGLETIHALVLSNQAFEVFKGSRYIDLEALAGHNARVATMAQELIRSEGGSKEDCEAAFVSGLLHDIGLLIFADSLGEQYDWLIEAAMRRKIPIHLAERKVFAADHGELGAYLLGLWGLADPIVEAVALHHRPVSDQFTPTQLVEAVHLADVMDSEWRGSPMGTPADPRAGEMITDAERLERWKLICTSVIDKAQEEQGEAT